MSPANFALVMATGIVSIAAHLLGFDVISKPLFALNCVFYMVLWALTLLRVFRYRQEVVFDLTTHSIGAGFLTTVAATCVLGSQSILLFGWFQFATVLLGVGAFLWIVLTYAIFTAFTIKQDKPSLAKGINGGWLLAVVATQSVAVLTALLAAHWGQPTRLHANYVALSMWLWGGMFYIWIISLIFYRYTFFRFEPDDLAPPYWINMGAMAISVLAGSLLLANSDSAAPFLHSTRPFLEGFTIFFWATGTWWIPIIAILAVWRYGYKRLPFEYDPLYWGAVFPLGMHSAATYKMADVMNLEFLDFIPKVFLVLALAAWLATLIGMSKSIVRQLRPMSSAPDSAAP
ncbi:MAG: tellurite resistance/C4-dicarboxylate transporter family protein [Solirubrobacterales bacterium]|nr:tellurite resistance/C4-dicarboxylate transporter family protein [Solirubrobacterales bacterium]